MDGFRPGGNLAFERLSDGSVLVARLQTTENKKQIIRHSHVISAEDWIDLITYLSKDSQSIDKEEREDRQRVAMWFHEGEELQPPLKSDS